MCCSTSLILIDELGAGTDPVEGAALAVAVIGYARQMGACVAATTHYAELKTFALTTDGVENASCEFDVQSLQPTYRLLTGIPGKSNAFAIAARLGLQPTIIDRAKEQVSTEDARFEDVLAELERERRRIEKMKEEAQRMRSAAQSERDRMRAERDAAEKRADKMMEGARSQADNILKNARMTAETVFDELETLKKQSQKKASEQNLAAAKAALRGVITQTENEQRRGIQKRVVDAEEVRPLAAEVHVLPRVHGSGMFTRGQTQVLTLCTLGTLGDAQELDTIFEEKEKRYIHHYNFPSFSVGETRPSRGPGRREIGHGALAERALLPVIPPVSEFPYALRLVSEVISSNGSTSQGSVCGSTLALMDAGVPIKAPVAGISCGLITDGGQETTFTDIQGVEDFYGDMDFKVAGTKKGITAIQVDIKVDGLTPNIIKQAFEKCRVARYGILDEIMLKAIPQPREDVSDWAPKMTTMHINPDKIREVIGKGGSVIQNIVAESGAKVDIEDDGTVTIAAVKATDADKAKKMIEAIVKEPEPGEIYYGKVVRLMNFGAFVNLLPGKDGMVHISKMADHRIEKVEDAVKEGDMVWVKVMEIDDKGRVNLSMKDVKPEEKVK